MRLTHIVAILAVQLSPCLAAQPPLLTVDMRMGRVSANKEVVSLDKETDMEVAVLRLRTSPEGRIFLLKTKKQGDYMVFGRKVTLDADGQYLVKNEGDKGVTTTIAAGKIITEKWEPTKELKEFFAIKSAPAEDIIPLEKPQPNPGRDPISAVTTIPGTIGAPVKLLPPPPGMSESGYFTDQARPRAGAEAYVYPVESGMEPEYAVQPGDTLDIVFYRVQRVTVDLKGDIRIVSAIGNAEAVVPAAGKTSTEIATMAANSGLNFTTLANPAIRVKVSEFAESTVIVLGEVKKVGRITVNTEAAVGIREIIESAGGLAIQEGSAVILIRRGERVVKIDLAKSKKEAIDKFEVRPGDIITVNKK